MYRYLIFILLLNISVSFAGTQHYTVSSATEINAKNWQAGDTIIMKNGDWINQSILIKGEGTELSPVVLISETPGKVILSGSSSLGLSGRFIEISGLYFKGGTLSGKDIIAFRTSSTSFAENCSLKNTAIISYNPSDKTVDSKWVSLYGKNNRINHCTFENKTNAGTLLVVWLQNGIVPNHIIENNYFGYRNPNLDSSGNELNGQEIIRIGDSSTSMQTAGVKVTDNFFEHCNGEMEIVSNKSCGNYYLNNIFLECKGVLTLRHGNNCTVDGNYFIGNGVSGTGGVRIIGENHKVYNNYLEKLTGTNYRSAICMVRGLENSPLNEYFQVKNALVAFNTMVNCTQSFSINYNSSSTCTMPPVGSVIANNHVYNSSSSNTNIKIDQTSLTAMDVVWKNNLMNQGKYFNFNFVPNQVITGIDPKMTWDAKANIYEPTSGTGLSDFSTSDYNEITLDIRGRDRNSLKFPGASQASGTTSRIAPQKDFAGVSFSVLSTSASVPVKANSFKAYSFLNQLITEVPVSGELAVFDLTGTCLELIKISAGVNRNTFSGNGIYLVGFKSNASETAFCKVVFSTIYR